MSEKEKQDRMNEAALNSLETSLKILRQSKPDDRSELARRYAVTITELEKVYAYFDTYVIRGDGA